MTYVHQNNCIKCNTFIQNAIKHTVLLPSLFLSQGRSWAPRSQLHFKGRTVQPQKQKYADKIWTFVLQLFYVFRGCTCVGETFDSESKFLTRTYIFVSDFTDKCNVINWWEVVYIFVRLVVHVIQSPIFFTSSGIFVISKTCGPKVPFNLTVCAAL